MNSTAHTPGILVPIFRHYGTQVKILTTSPRTSPKATSLLPANRHQRLRNLGWGSDNLTSQSPVLSSLISQRMWANHKSMTRLRQTAIKARSVTSGLQPKRRPPRDLSSRQSKHSHRKTLRTLQFPLRTLSYHGYGSPQERKMGSKWSLGLDRVLSTRMSPSTSLCHRWCS